MWVLTKTEWPTLVNLSVAATIGYQQPVKLEPRMRVIAGTWEQELVLAECDSGDQAKEVLRLVAQALRQGNSFLDLSQLELTRLDHAAGSTVVDGVI